MKKIIYSASLSILLAGCSSIADGQSDLVTFKTPGAENARCIMENDDYKYVAYTDQTIRVQKSPNDMVVTCQAPGNRERSVLVKREINGWVVGNIVTGIVPGMAYDYFGRGAFNYPDSIVVDFIGEPIKPYDLPEYAAQDLANKNHVGITEYQGPGVVISEQNKGAVVPLQKKTNLFNNFEPQAGGKASSNYSSSSAPAYSSGLPAVSYDPMEEDK